MKWLLFFFYISILIYIVFFARRRQILVWHVDLVNLIPLKKTINSYRNLKDEGELNFLTNLFGNVLLFVPLSFFINNLFKVSNKLIIVVLGALISILIEFLQYYWRVGITDIDDILLNTSGMIIGITFWEMINSKINNKL